MHPIICIDFATINKYTQDKTKLQMEAEIEAAEANLKKSKRSKKHKEVVKPILTPFNFYQAHNHLASYAINNMMIPGKVEKFIYLINVERINVTDFPIGLVPSCLYRGVRDGYHEEE